MQDMFRLRLLLRLLLGRLRALRLWLEVVVLESVQVDDVAVQPALHEELHLLAHAPHAVPQHRQLAPRGQGEVAARAVGMVLVLRGLRPAAELLPLGELLGRLVAVDGDVLDEPAALVRPAAGRVDADAGARRGRGGGLCGRGGGAGACAGATLLLLLLLVLGFRGAREDASEEVRDEGLCIRA